MPKRKHSEEKCSLTPTRRNTLKVAAGAITSSLLATASAKAQDSDSSCSYFKLTNTQARNVRMTYDEDDHPVVDMLKRIENSSSKANFVYQRGDDDHFYETGDNTYESIDNNTWLDFVLTIDREINLENTPEAVELNNQFIQMYNQDADCTQLPFERDFDMEITSSPSDPEQGESVILEASPVEANSGNIVNYEWDTNDDESIDKTGQTISTTFNQERTVVSVTATTDVSTTGAGTTVITTTPTTAISPSFEYQPKMPVAGDEVTFDATGSTADGTDITAYEWDLTGDGEIDATGNTAVHAYEEGTHTVSLTVRGDDGTTLTTEQRLEVGGSDSDESIPEESTESDTSTDSTEPNDQDESDDGKSSEPNSSSLPDIAIPVVISLSAFGAVLLGVWSVIIRGGTDSTSTRNQEE